MTTLEQTLLATTLQTTDNCQLWQGTLYPSGYAKIHQNGVAYVGHRLLYTLHYGSIPEGKLILHNCDQRNCINPLHLRAGTSAENNQDTLERHNAPRAKGRKHSSANLTETIVLEIRRQLALGVTPRQVSTLFTVPYKTIIAIRSRATWSWLNDQA